MATRFPRQGAFVFRKGKCGIIAEIDTSPLGLGVAEIHYFDPKTGETNEVERPVPISELVQATIAQIPKSRAFADPERAAALGYR
jgi:hypothetical protein